jgi:MFS family permease
MLLLTRRLFGRAGSRDAEWSESVLSIYIPAFILAVGVNVAAPALPLFAKSFQVDFGMASLTLILNQLGAALSTIPTGYLVDRIGARKIVLLGPVMTALASLLMAFAHSFPELLVYRFLEGWAMQMWMVGRLEMITARGGSNRGTIIGGMAGMDNAGRLMGAAVGGFLAAAWGLRAPFIVYAVLAIAAILPSFFMMSDVRRSRSSTAEVRPVVSTRQAAGALLTTPILLLLAGQFMASMTRGSLIGGTLDLYAVYAYGIDAKTLGTLAAVGGLLGLPLVFTVGRLMDRFGRRTIVVPGFTLLGAALSLMAVSAFGHWPFAGYVAAFLFARVSINSVSGTMQVLSSDSAPPEFRGLFLGVMSLCRQIGAFLSPAMFAVLSQALGFGSSFETLSLMSLGTAALMWKQLSHAGAESAPAQPQPEGQSASGMVAAIRG